MDKRLILAVVLSVGFLLIWTYLFTPQPPPQGTDGSAQPGNAGPAAGAGPGPGDATAPPKEIAPAAAPHAAPEMAGLSGPGPAAARPALPPGERIGAASEEEIVVATPLLEIRLSNRGGRVTSWKLKEYLDDEKRPLDLVSAAGRKLDHLPLQILVEDPEATRRIGEALYRADRKERAEDGRTATEVSFTWSDGRGTAVAKSLRIAHDSYITELSFAAEAAGRPVAPTLVWGAGFGAHTGLESGQYADAATAVLKDGGRIERRPGSGLKPEEPWRHAGAIAWAGLEDKYFAALLVPETPVEGQVRFEALRLVEEGREHLHLSAALRLAGASRVRLFVGPKDYDLLKGLGLGLEGLVDFGFFGIIARPLFYGLKFLEHYVHNFGWAIVILTIVIRLLFFPFMHKGQLKMRRMQDKMKRLQPKVQGLRERYRKLERKEAGRGNARARRQLRQRMNEEMMALYKEEGVDPFGSMSGCLPLLLQIPILYAFYTILTIAIELRGAQFLLWIRDLSQKDPYYVTPIVMGVTMLVQQAMTSGSIPDPTQRRIMYVMPIMFTYFFINLPSGLVLYWLVNNLLGIGQQYLINKEAEAGSKRA
ncbi:MAG: membrane protein insertase YidC [Acidobacteria bacterium]|nr:membrane protein insertase YidC [Acidobacteriota bacterium]